MTRLVYRVACSDFSRLLVGVLVVLAGCATGDASDAGDNAVDEDPLTQRRPCDTGLFWQSHLSRQVYIEPYRGDGRPFTGVRVFVGQELSLILPGTGWTPSVLPAGIAFVDRAVARPAAGPVTTIRFVATGAGSAETTSTVYAPMTLIRPRVAGETTTLERQELTLHVNPRPTGVTWCTVGGSATCPASTESRVCTPITSSPGAQGICGSSLCTELVI